MALELAVVTCVLEHFERVPEFASESIAAKGRE